MTNLIPAPQVVLDGVGAFAGQQLHGVVERFAPIPWPPQVLVRVVSSGLGVWLSLAGDDPEARCVVCGATAVCTRVAGYAACDACCVHGRDHRGVDVCCPLTEQRRGAQVGGGKTGWRLGPAALGLILCHLRMLPFAGAPCPCPRCARDRSV